MNIDELRALVSQPESDVLEFKTRLTEPQIVARVISAFANSRGGTLIVGVKEGGEIVGVDDPTRTRRILEYALQRISPQINIESEVVAVDGRSLLVVKTPSGQHSPYFIDGHAFRRTGDAITSLTSNEIYSVIRDRATTLDDVLAQVKRLATMLEKQNGELAAAKSWRSKLADMVLGGIVGALISLALGIVIGLR